LRASCPSGPSQCYYSQQPLYKTVRPSNLHLFTQCMIASGRWAFTTTILATKRKTLKQWPGYSLQAEIDTAHVPHNHIRTNRTLNFHLPTEQDLNTFALPLDSREQQGKTALHSKPKLLCLQEAGIPIVSSCCVGYLAEYGSSHLEKGRIRAQENRLNLASSDHWFESNIP